ncbi:hypothetical protein [Planctomicrobium piriforme]|uniref:Uncharacterized protein n=1 Tax=Planctomicrobium piriforme TaxID=1576369 RepID=A0A1I3DHC7_9PLAN|nr:hypothetical protein [Planctomicrobium piriforme]SFH85989.1 hypothetical protein SAMN05421753_103236 [Planctomicrobium piriforme]
MTQDLHSPEIVLRSTQIIAIALIAGVISTTGIVTFLGNTLPPRMANTGDTISFVMAGFTALCVVAMGVASNWGVRADASRDPKALAAAWQTRTIVKYAICEIAALANAVAYIVEQNWWSLALQIVMLAVMVLIFPTKTRLDQFIESQTAFTQ